MKQIGKIDTKKLTTLAMVAAVSYALVCLIRIPVVLFLSYEPKDTIIAIGGFILGPTAALIASVVVSLLEMVTISQTGPIGLLMNVISTCCFACTAAFIYKRRRSMAGAVIGLVAGTLLMTAAMILWNWLITPIYMGYPREAVEALLVPVFLPFNLVKAGLNSAITILLYKPLVTGLRKVHLLEPSRGGKSIAMSSRIAVYAGGLVLLVTCILLILVLQGKL